MKAEFKKGDIVTYKPYERAALAQVVEIVPPHKVDSSPDDKSVYYRLKGVNPKKRVKAVTTGASIVESVLFWDSIEDKVKGFFSFKYYSTRYTVTKIEGIETNLPHLRASLIKNDKAPFQYHAAKVLKNGELSKVQGGLFFRFNSGNMLKI